MGNTYSDLTYYCIYDNKNVECNYNNTKYTYNDDEQKKEDPSKKEILEEWDTHMKDFVPEDMLTIDL